MNMPYSYFVTGAVRLAPSIVTLTGLTLTGGAAKAAVIGIAKPTHVASINPYRILRSLLLCVFIVLAEAVYRAEHHRQLGKPIPWRFPQTGTD
jgi:hypothetical protein